MKTRILLTLLCAMSLQTQAFFGSQMLSTAWKTTASFCKEHPIAVATVAAACGISYWLYKKYTKTTSANTATATSTTTAAPSTSAATAIPASEGATEDDSARRPFNIVRSGDDNFKDFDTFVSSEKITFEDIDYNVVVSEDIFDKRLELFNICNNIYTIGFQKDFVNKKGQSFYGFKIMIGEKTVGLLIGEKNFNSPTLKIFMFVLYKNLCTDHNYEKIIQKIKDDNPTIITLEADFVGIMFDDIKERQRAIYRQFGFTELRETNFEMSLMQDASAGSLTRTPSASRARAGAASATDQSDSLDEEDGKKTPQPSPASTSLRSDETPRASGAARAAAGSLFDDEEDQAGEDFFNKSKPKPRADAGAVEEDDAFSVAGSEYTTTDETARLLEVASEEETASEGASAASEVKVDIQFRNIQTDKIPLEDMKRLGKYYEPERIKIIVQNDGFRILINSELVGIVIYKKNGFNIEIEFLALKNNFRGKIIIEEIIKKLKRDNDKATHILATLNNVLYHCQVSQIDLYHAFGLHRKQHASGSVSTSFYRKF